MKFKNLCPCNGIDVAENEIIIDVGSCTVKVYAQGKEIDTQSFDFKSGLDAKKA